MKFEDIISSGAGLLVILIPSLFVIWFGYGLFFAHDVTPYLSTNINNGFIVEYSVKMERKFGEDRILLITNNLEEAQNFYFKMINNR